MATNYFNLDAELEGKSPIQGHSFFQTKLGKMDTYYHLNSEKQIKAVKFNNVSSLGVVYFFFFFLIKTFGEILQNQKFVSDI